MGDRLVWKRGRESQNDTGPSSSGKFETADKTSGHVSIQPDDFSRTMTHYCPFRENRKINKLRIENTQNNLYFFLCDRPLEVVQAPSGTSYFESKASSVPKVGCVFPMVVVSILFRVSRRIPLYQTQFAKVFNFCSILYELTSKSEFSL